MRGRIGLQALWPSTLPVRISEAELVPLLMEAVAMMNLDCEVRTAVNRKSMSIV